MEESNKTELALPKRIRRTHSKSFKAKLVALVAAGDQSIAQIALEHNLNANQLHKWIKTSEARVSTTKMVPVCITPNHLRSSPVMELSIADAVLRFHSAWDPSAVAQLIKAVK